VKQSRFRAKTKRTATKKMALLKARAVRPLTAPGVETVVVDVVEEPSA
jgi:hypothetical protein